MVRVRSDGGGQARRGRDRDAGGGAAGAVSDDLPRAGRRQSAGDDPLCQYGYHQPLNRQSESLAREGIDLDDSTMADWVGARTAALAPLVELIRRPVLGAARLHGDDTTVPVLAKGKTATGRVWTYVCDDRPFAGPAPLAAVFFYSRNRDGEHPRKHPAAYAGILQADAYGGFNGRYDPTQSPGPITEAACWSHGWRKFFVLADVAKSPRGGNSRRHLPSRRCVGSARASRSARSTDCRRSSVSPCALPTGAMAASA
jgi:hypothetical protein